MTDADIDRSYRSSRYGLELRDLTAQVGSFRVGPISLTVPPGRTLALIGPSGCGKSTLLRAIAGFERSRAGTVLFHDTDVSALPPGDRRVGFVFQDYALFPHLSAGGNIEFPLRLRRNKRDEVERRLLEIAEELDIPREYLPRDVAELPEGIKQLTAIGRERAHLFDVLILDEPLTQLDAYLRTRMRVFIRELVRSFGKTSVVALTDPEDILSISDYAAVIDDGKLVDFAPTSQLYRQPGHPVTIQMLSPLGLNSLPLERGRPERVYFRPEDTRVTDNRDRDRDHTVEQEVPGRLEKRSFLDARRELLRLNVDGRLVTVVAPIGTARRTGPDGGNQSGPAQTIRFIVTRPVVF